MNDHVTVSTFLSADGLVKGEAMSNDKLYIGDNGRVFCGALRCAGMSAYYSGRGISGQPIEELPARDAREHGLRCESCGFDGLQVRK